jgi:AbrB family looped-hinge helix DNA binding protein
MRCKRVITVRERAERTHCRISDIHTVDFSDENDALRPGNQIARGVVRHPFVEPIVGLGLADGPANGNLYAMKTTIDHAGRLVIPRDIRRESGIKPGMPLEVRWEKGAIAIIPAPLEVKLERKGRLLVAVPTKNTPRLSTDTVERTRKTLRKERSGASN